MNGRLLSAQPVSESGCQTQSWSQRDFISGISTSPGLAVERILFPSVPEPEMSLFNKSGIREFIWPSRFLLGFPVSSPCSSPVLVPYPSGRYGLWPPSQWFFQLLTRGGDPKCHCSSLVNLGFFYMPGCWKSESRLEVEHLLCECWCASRELQARFKYCVYF